MDARCRIAKSTIPGAGDGLFAAEPFRKGDLLEVVGVTFERGSEADLCTAYGNSYKYEHGNLMILPTGCAAMLNDSDTPNMQKFTKEGKLYLQAIQNIEAGAELTLRYGPNARRRYTNEGPRPVS